MEKETKKKIKQIERDLKVFQKMAKSNPEESLNLVAKLKINIKELINLEDIKKDVKISKKFKQVMEGLNLYVTNIKSIEKFKKKWD